MEEIGAIHSGFRTMSHETGRGNGWLILNVTGGSWRGMTFGRKDHLNTFASHTHRVPETPK